MAERSLNRVELIGRLGKDCEVKFTPSGVAVTNFSVATSTRWKDKKTEEWQEKTEWHRIVLWRSEKVSGYLLKGTKVRIEGRLETRSWDDKDGTKKYMTEIVCDDVMLLGSKRDGESDGAPVSRPRTGQNAKAQGDDPADYDQGAVDPDDVPF
jgi:single-strand DNA-binding protein